MPEAIRLYLDQMIQTRVAHLLRQEEFDVLRASETGQSRADDQEILRFAVSEQRILVTLDEHFGDWVVLPLSTHFGVIRVKVSPTTLKGGDKDYEMCCSPSSNGKKDRRN